MPVIESEKSEHTFHVVSTEPSVGGTVVKQYRLIPCAHEALTQAGKIN